MESNFNCKSKRRSWKNYNFNKSSASLAALEFKTLLIDADPQANTTSGLGINRIKLKKQYMNAWLIKISKKIVF